MYGFRACGLRLGWTELLAYEHEIRKQAIKRVNRGEASLCEALTSALKDADLKQLHFTLPLSTMGKRDTPQRNDDNERPPKGRKLEQELKRLKAENEQLRKQSSSSSSGQTSAPYPPPPPQPREREKPKGGAKGKGGGKNMKKAEQLKEMRNREKLMMQLPGGGGLICYYYNIDSCTRGRDCSFHHVCMRCGLEGHTALDNKCRQIPNAK